MSSYAVDEPIYALATAYQPSALAVIRASGEGSWDLLRPYFSGRLSSGKASHGYISGKDGKAIDEVVVYGKIPRNSIAIPTIAGESYSPDFMYVVKKDNGEKELNVVVETKDVKSKSDLRDIESTKIKCAEVFFKNLSAQGYNVCFRTQLGNENMLQIVKDVLQQ